MPSNTRSMHPSGKVGITFTEADHLYVDDFGMEYTSTTTLIHSAFEEFDGPRIAAAKSIKTGVPAEQYLAEWEENRNRAATEGTRLHENCERQILGRYPDMHQSADDAERLRFRAAWQEVEKIKSAFIKLEPEKIIFSPRFRVAGSIDLLARRADGNYCIFDWKVVKELKREGFQGRRGVCFATQRLPDCNFYHYALQLAIYELILKIEGYIPMSAGIDRWLLVYRPDGTFEPVRLPELTYEAMAMLAFNISHDGLEEIPF